MKIMTDLVFTVVAGFILGFVLLCLGGCQRKTPVETAFNSVENSVVALEKTLPIECKTEVVSEKIAQVRLEMAKAQTECEKKINEYKIKYERLLMVVSAMVLLWAIKFFYLKR